MLCRMAANSEAGLASTTLLIRKNHLGLIARSVRGLKWRDSGCLKGEAAVTAPSCSSVAGRSEHTYGTEAQWSVDSSGIGTQDLYHFRASGRRSNQLSYLLLLPELLFLFIQFLSTCTNYHYPISFLHMLLSSLTGNTPTHVILRLANCPFDSFHWFTKMPPSALFSQLLDGTTPSTSALRYCQNTP